MLILTKNTWKGINQLININSKGNKRPSSVIAYEVENNFNEYSHIAE